MKFFIYPNYQKTKALSHVIDLVEYLSPLPDCRVFADERSREDLRYFPGLEFGCFEEDISKMDFAVAVGGDGTILECSKYLRKNEVRLLGINTGRLGFISSMEADELYQLRKLFTGDYSISKRMMLKGETAEHSVSALNDIVIYEKNSKMIEFEIVRNGCETVGSYRANGVIFSTPTGSTAYALSAGGPILQPEMSCIEMTLICPHSLFARPVVFTADSELSVRFSLRDYQQVFLTADGDPAIEVGGEETVKIKQSKYKIGIVNFENNSFFDSLSKKFMHPIK